MNFSKKVFLFEENGLKFWNENLFVYLQNTFYFVFFKNFLEFVKFIKSYLTCDADNLLLVPIVENHIFGLFPVLIV